MIAPRKLGPRAPYILYGPRGRVFVESLQKKIGARYPSGNKTVGPKKKIGARYPNGNKTVGREHTVTTWTPGTFFFS